MILIAVYAPQFIWIFLVQNASHHSILMNKKNCVFGGSKAAFQIPALNIVMSFAHFVAIKLRIVNLV